MLNAENSQTRRIQHMLLLAIPYLMKLLPSQQTVGAFPSVNLLSDHISTSIAVYLTSGPAYQSDFSQATSSVAQYQLPCVAPGSLVNRHNPPGINTIHHTSASGVPSTSNDPPPTAERQEKWCYCGHYEYGKVRRVHVFRRFSSLIPCFT